LLVLASNPHYYHCSSSLSYIDLGADLSIYFIVAIG